MTAESILMFSNFMVILSIVFSVVAIFLSLRGVDKSDRTFVFSVVGMNLIPILIQFPFAIRNPLYNLTPLFMLHVFLLLAAASFLLWSMISQGSSYTHFTAAVAIIFVVWIYLSRGLFAPFFDRHGLFIGFSRVVPEYVFFIAARLSLMLTCIVVFVANLGKLRRKEAQITPTSNGGDARKRCDQCGGLSDADAGFCMHCGIPFS